MTEVVLFVDRGDAATCALWSSKDRENRERSEEEKDRKREERASSILEQSAHRCDMNIF